MSALSVNESRYVAVFEAVKSLKKFTCQQVASKLTLNKGEFLEGRKLKAVLGDMQLEKLLKKDKDNFSLTPHGRSVLGALTAAAATEKQIDSSHVEAPTDVSINEDDFVSQLTTAVALTEPRRAKNDTPWWKSSIKERVEFEKGPTQLVSQEELDFKAPEAPLRGANVSERSRFDEVLEDFYDSYEENPKATVDKIGKMVIAQRSRLQAQDRLIREMHVHLRDLSKLLNAYVYNKEA